MSTMTIERRKKIENHIVKTYFTKHFGIEHGSNGWDIIRGSSDRDIPTVLANPTWDENRVVIRWFIPDEVSYINPECAKVATYYDLVVGPELCYVSDYKLELDKANEKIEELDRCLDQADSIIREWKSNTCCETPTDARKHIEELMQENASLQASVHNLEFTKAIGKEFSLKGCSTRRAFAIKRNTIRYFKSINALNHILYGDGSTTYGRSLEGIQKYLDKNGYSCVMDAIDQLEVENDTLKEAKKRCDSIDDMLEKDKKCIEFSMRSIIVTHKPYQEDTDIAITGMIPGREILADNPFDIPCDVVMVSKRYFERLQAANEQLKKNLRLLNDRNRQLGDAITKERSYILELQKEIAAWQDATSCKVPMEAQSRIVNLLNDLGNSTLRIDSLKTRIAGWERSADYWGNKLNEWKKATECDTPEEAKEIIDCLKENKHARYNKLWITTNGLLISESDKTVDVLEAQVEEASKVISEWQRIAECDTPDTLKWKLYYLRKWVRNCEDEIKKLKGDIQAFRDDKAGRNTLIESLHRDISKWRAATECSDPEHAEKEINKLADRYNSAMKHIDEWQNATGCKLTSMAKEKIEHYERRLGNAVQAASCAAKHLENITF